MEKVLAVLEKNTVEDVHVALTEYKGHDLFALRVYVDSEDGKEKIPTRKGLTVSVKLLPELAQAVNAALLEAEKAGLLKEETLERR